MANHDHKFSLVETGDSKKEHSRASTGIAVLAQNKAL